MATQYNVEEFLKGLNGFGLPSCDTIKSTTLQSNTIAVVTTPSTSGMGTLGTTIYASIGSPGTSCLNKFIAVINYTPGDDIFLAINGTVAVPAGAAFLVTTSELLPGGGIAKYVKAGDTLNFISAGTPSITVSFYAIQE